MGHLTFNLDNFTWEGKYLNFNLRDPGKKWAFINKEGIEVGWLEKVRVGAWMHWCHFLNDECYLSPGCADEVREFQRQLGGKKGGIKHKYKTCPNCKKKGWYMSEDCFLPKKESKCKYCDMEFELKKIKGDLGWQGDIPIFY